MLLKCALLILTVGARRPFWHRAFRSKSEWRYRLPRSWIVLYDKRYFFNPVPLYAEQRCAI
jgi:hypothetical protein